MIVIAVVIVFVYIKPTFEQIRSTQETTKAYVAEYEKVSDVNILLKKQVAIVDSVSPADVTALKRYMPDSVDDVIVMKDILAIFTALKLPLGGISVGGGVTAATADAGAAKITPHTFAITSQMSYTDLKRLLHVLEVNDYLLQVDSLNLVPSTSGIIGVTMGLTTFSRNVVQPVVAATEDSNSENQ